MTRLLGSRAAPVVAAGLAALPFLATALVLLARWPSFLFADDRALMELAVRDASRFDQLVGNGSRFGWSHPGPALYYLMAPLYQALGERPVALTLAMLLIHAGGAGGAVWLMWRRGGPIAGLVATTGVLVYTLAAGPQIFTNLWPPYAVVLPLLLVLALAVTGAGDARSLWALVLAAVVASAMVQTKIEMVVVLPPVLLAALVLRVRRFGLPAAEVRRPPVLLLLGLLVLVWVPPGVEQLTSHPGNLTLIARFVLDGGSGEPTPSLATALAAVGYALSVFPLGDRHHVIDPGFADRLGQRPAWPLLLALAYLVAASVVVFLGRRRSRPLASDLALFTLVALVSSVVWVTRISGPVHFYLVVWATVLPVALWVAAAALVTEPGRLRWGAAVAAAGAGVVLMAVVATAVLAPTHDYNRARSAEVAAAARKVTVARGERAHFRIPVHDRWLVAAGVAVALEKRGAVVTVDDEWVFLFGDNFRSSPRRPPDLEVTFGPGDRVVVSRAGSGRRPGA